jgi:hypothetical protein
MKDALSSLFTAPAPAPIESKAGLAEAEAEPAALHGAG